MRFTALLTLASSVSSVSAAAIREARPVAAAVNERQAGPASRPDIAARHPAHAAAHAARRSPGHGSGLRKVRRRRRSCKAKTTVAATSTAAAEPASTSSDSWAASSASDSWSSSDSSGAASASDSAATGSLVDGSLYSKPKTTTNSKTSSATESESSSDSWGSASTASSSAWDSASTESAGSWSSSSSSDSSSWGTTTSTANGSASTSTSSSDAFSGVLAQLFPAGSGSASWTTCPQAANVLSFSDALTPLQSGNLPGTTTDSGETVHTQTYPAGGIGGTTGMNWYTLGQKDNVSPSSAKELLFSYSVKFVNFDWVKGGKLPGLYGGTSFAEAKSCSGGRQDARNNCFSTRLMWRENGMGEIYNYLPQNSANSAYCSTPPLSVCNAQYGDSIGRGAWSWQNNEWNVVSQRIKLNDVGSANGEQQVFINGVSVLNLSGLELIVEQGAAFYGIMAQSFFGGGDSSYAPSSDQTAYFKDYSLITLA